MSRTARSVLATISGVVLAALLLWTPVGSDADERADVVHEEATNSEALVDASSAQPATAAEPTPVVAASPIEPDATEREVVRGPRGRVVMRETGEPVAGVPVIMRFGSKVLAETVSDADGNFALPEPDRKGRRVQVDSDEWRATVSSIRLDEAQSSGETPLLFEVEHVPVALIRGRLVDVATNEPVPHYLIELSGPRPGTGSAAKPALTRDRLTTAADGRFASDRALEEGTYTLVLHDDKASAQSSPWQAEPREVELVHQLGGGEQNIAINVGPTYYFDGELPEGTQHDDFTVSFPASSKSSRAAHQARAKDETGILSAGGNPLFGAYMGEMPAIRTHLRDGQTPWVRFREPIREVNVQLMLNEFGELPPDWSLELQVRSNDGHWAASSTVDSTQGIYPRNLALDFEPQGSLHGEVLDVNGKAVGSAWVVARSATAAGHEPIEIGVDRHGAFELQFLSAGELSVRVEAESFITWEGEVTITPFETTQLDVQLVSAGEFGSITGILKSRTGEYRPRNGAQVLLQRLDTDAAPDFRMVRFRRGSDGRTASFEFERVPAGEYELSIETTDNYAWNQRSIRVSSPASDVEFICEDDVDTRDLELRPIDARSGASIEPNWAMLWVGESASEQQLDRHWDTNRFEAIPQDQRYRWLVRAAGYRLATGDESAFRLEDDLWVLDVALQPGWGQAFRVTTDTKRPLEGVALFADGERIGVTDAQGLVLMDLKSKPQALRFELDGWHYKWGRIDPAEEGFGYGVETAVHMERD